MLEIPESHVIANQIKQRFAGKAVTDVIAGLSPHGFGWYDGDPADYPKKLLGKTVLDCYAIGGLIEIDFGDTVLYFNDGVNIRYLEPGKEPPKKHQLWLAFNDGSAIVCTVQMYGGMFAFKKGTNENFYYLVAGEKPNPLTDAFDEPYFMDMVLAQDPKLSVKALLATEQRIPGLGNGCLHDILLRAKINPQSKIGRLEKADYSKMFVCLKTTLTEMAAAGGRDTEKDLYGNKGGYATLATAYKNAPGCPGCGGPIIKKAYMGGSVYYCETCQPVVK